MTKLIDYDLNRRKKLKNGIARLAKTVIITLDSKRRNIVSSGVLDRRPEKITKEDYMRVVYYGSNKKIDNIIYNDSTGQRNMGIQKTFSEETGKLIDEEVRKFRTSSTCCIIKTLQKKTD